MQNPGQSVRETTTGMRVLLLVAAVLVFISGFQLYVLSEATERFFAWTINPALTAAFLGGAYWASGVLQFMASRRRIWAEARLAIPAVLVFTTLTLVISLLHLDRFHLAVADQVARGAAWAWLLIYVVVPPLLAILWFRQMRAPGGDPPIRAPLPAWAQGVLAIHVALLLPFGIALLIVPQVMSGLWPWMLTPLTGRAIGAWFTALGIAALQAIRENDWARIRIGGPAYVAFGVLELIALVRYSSVVNWASPTAWVLVALLVSMVLGGAYAWRQPRLDS